MATQGGSFEETTFGLTPQDKEYISERFHEKLDNLMDSAKDLLPEQLQELLLPDPSIPLPGEVPTVKIPSITTPAVTFETSNKWVPLAAGAALIYFVFLK